jgi:hypothetical protein
MPFQKGVSGNPQGRALQIAQKLVNAGIQPSENVYIPILDKRDPAKELIRLADKTTDKEFKKSIWMFLFEQKYRAMKIIAKPIQVAANDATSDEDVLRALEGKSESKGVETQSKGLTA